MKPRNQTMVLPGMFNHGITPKASTPDYVVPTNSHAPETSRANTMHFSGRVGDQRLLVFTTIQRAGDRGMTCWEVEQATGLRHSSTSGRIWELRGGYDKWPWVFIRDSGRRRKTDSGSEAIVWVALEKPEPVLS